jgi:hypothetical protein
MAVGVDKSQFSNEKVSLVLLLVSCLEQNLESRARDHAFGPQISAARTATGDFLVMASSTSTFTQAYLTSFVVQREIHI